MTHKSRENRKIGCDAEKRTIDFLSQFGTVSSHRREVSPDFSLQIGKVTLGIEFKSIQSISQGEVGHVWIPRDQKEALEDWCVLYNAIPVLLVEIRLRGNPSMYRFLGITEKNDLTVWHIFDEGYKSPADFLIWILGLKRS